MIVVTGASGTVGSETVRQLAGAGHKVRALVRDPAKAPALAGVEVVIGDLGKPETLAEAFAGADRALVIAPVEPEMVTYETNAYRAAAEAGVGHLVKISNYAAGQYDDAVWSWHAASEKVVRESGVPWTILRPVRFMTDTPFTWAPIVANGTILESPGSGRTTLIDPIDVAAVAATVLTTAGHDGQIYRLTGTERLTGADIAAKIAAAIGRGVSVPDTTVDGLHATFVAAGIPPYVADILLQYVNLVEQDFMQVTTTVADLIGRAPRTYDEWLRDNAKIRIAQAST